MSTYLYYRKNDTTYSVTGYTQSEYSVFDGYSTDFLCFRKSDTTYYVPLTAKNGINDSSLYVYKNGIKVAKTSVPNSISVTNASLNSGSYSTKYTENWTSGNYKYTRYTRTATFVYSATISPANDWSKTKAERICGCSGASSGVSISSSGSNYSAITSSTAVSQTITCNPSWANVSDFTLTATIGYAGTQGSVTSTFLRIVDMTYTKSEKEV